MEKNTATYKKGQRVRFAAFPFGGGVDWSETGRVLRVTRAMMPMPDGYFPVRFDSDGAVLLVHHERLMPCNAA